MGSMEKGSIRYTDRQIEIAPYTRIENGLIKAVTLDGYTVEINEKLYPNVLVLNSVSLSVNNTVKVMIPNNQYSNMFILGKIGI